jgi:hypothetical protein
MADIPLSPGGCDVEREPDMEWPDRDCGHLVREIRDRIEADRLYEHCLQQQIIKMLQSARTGQRISGD